MKLRHFFEQSAFERISAKRLAAPIIATWLGAMSTLAIAAELDVTVGPVQEAEGEIMLAVYNNAESFSHTAFKARKATAATGDVSFSFKNLPAGEYAIMVFHDVNGNGELDTNLFGMPSEPWGGSLQGKQLFGPPQWEDARFELSDSGLSLTVKLHAGN